MPFTERTPIEQGFTDVYETQVQPLLNEVEFERKAILSKTYRNMAILVVVALAAIGATYGIWGDRFIVGACIIAAIGGGFGLFMIWGGAGDRWTSKIEDITMPVICDHVGDLTYSKDGSRFRPDPLKDLNLLPSHDRASRSNLFSGTRNGAEFQMVHTTLTTVTTDNEDRERTTTVFQGLLFRIEMPEAAPGRISLMRERGGIGNKMAEKLAFGTARSWPKVSFDHEAFEAAFEVYSDAPESAHSYLSPALLDALLEIGSEQGHGAQSYVAGFDKNAFYMALTRPGRAMAMGSITTSVGEIEEDLHRAFDEIALVHMITDRLHGARPSR